MSASVMSRRASEALGVALFFSALLWFVALASYTPGDPAWFFYAGPPKQAANFAGTFGAFIAESSFQLLGYGSFLIPVVLIVAGYHYFWCRSLPAGYTKSIGAARTASRIIAVASRSKASDASSTTNPRVMISNVPASSPVCMFTASIGTIRPSPARCFRSRSTSSATSPVRVPSINRLPTSARPAIVAPSPSKRSTSPLSITRISVPRDTVCATRA